MRLFAHALILVGSHIQPTIQYHQTVMPVSVVLRIGMGGIKPNQPAQVEVLPTPIEIKRLSCSSKKGCH